MEPDTTKPIVTICLAARCSGPPSDIVDGLGRVREYAVKHGVPTNFGIGASGASVDFSRNIAVSHAVKATPRPTHLLMVDDDIKMPEGAIPALLACDAGIAGGCYPAIKKVREGADDKQIVVVVTLEALGQTLEQEAVFVVGGRYSGHGGDGRPR